MKKNIWFNLDSARLAGVFLMPKIAGYSLLINVFSIGLTLDKSLKNFFVYWKNGFKLEFVIAM